jgi:hypothetical protein
VKTSGPAYLEDSIVTDVLDRQLRCLLSACFADPCFVGQRYCHEMPQHRWIITEGSHHVITDIPVPLKDIVLKDGKIPVEVRCASGRDGFALYALSLLLEGNPE